MADPLGKLIMVIVVGLALAACGSNVDNVASLKTTQNDQAAKLTPNSADHFLDDEAKVMAFTQCMREKGMQFKDPVVDSEGNVQKPEPVEGVEYDKNELKAAYVACGSFLEGVVFGSKKVDLSAKVDTYVAMAACFRDKGYDIEDPTAETIETWMVEFKTVLDWQDPRVLAAYKTCTGSSTGSQAGSGK